MSNSGIPTWTLMTLASDSSVAIAPSCSHSLGVYNSGHTATLRSAQMFGFASHFACAQPLCEIAFKNNGVK